MLYKFAYLLNKDKKGKGKVCLYSAKIATHDTSATLSSHRAGVQSRPQPNPAATDFGLNPYSRA